MAPSIRWRSADLDVFPLDDGKRYEIIDGELFVSEPPSAGHQSACGEVYFALQAWGRQTGSGQTLVAPGLIFADDDDVAPDIVWVSHERLRAILAPDGHLHGAPELVVEVLSPGSTNERRDRAAKLDLYSRRGVDEYWIVDWQQRRIEVYRREQGGLRSVATAVGQDVLQSPLLPDFSLQVGLHFPDLP